MTDERRTDERVYLTLEARLEGQSGGYGARIADISLGGCFVDTRAVVSVGDVVTIEIKLPDGRWLTLGGQVAYYQHQVGFSMSFTFLTDEAQRALKQLIKSV
jgi:Tfp pilus assembly protein PilZ